MFSFFKKKPYSPLESEQVIAAICFDEPSLKTYKGLNAYYSRVGFTNDVPKRMRVCSKRNLSRIQVTTEILFLKHLWKVRQYKCDNKVLSKWMTE